MVVQILNAKRQKNLFRSLLTKNPRSSERGFFIQSEGLVWNPRARALYGIAAGVWHRAKRVSNLVPLRMDAIHHFVMIPYDCFAINSMPQKVADSIHALGVIWSKRHPNFPPPLAISPILCYTNHRKAVFMWGAYLN